MNNFTFVDCRTVDEALRQLSADASIKAGGIDLLDLMKEDIVSPSKLVNIRIWADPTRISPMARSYILARFVASLSQIPPIMPVLPTQPTHKSCSFYDLSEHSYRGMEEFIRSISTFEHGGIETHIGHIPPTKRHLSIPLGTTTQHTVNFYFQ